MNIKKLVLDTKKWLLASKKRVIAAILIVVMLIGAVSWLIISGMQPKKPIFQPIAIEAVQVRRGSIVRRITVVGTLLANQKVEIHPEIQGKIKKVLFKGGTFVEKDTPLIEINDKVFKASLKEATGRLTLAKAEYERHKRLVAKKAGPLKLFEKAQADLQQAEAAHDLATIKLDNTIIRAPFEGVVGLKNISQGMYVNEQTELVTIVDVDPIKMDFRLPATHLKVISKGQQIKVTIDGFENKIFRAIIESIDAKVDPAAHSIAVRAVISNKDGLLKPGLFGRVRIVVGSKDNTLLVPEAAVLSSGEEEYIFRIVDLPSEGTIVPTAIKTTVTTGLSEAGSIEIVRGLNEESMVITVGQSKIRHGYPVKIVPDIETADEDDEDDDDDDDDEEEDEEEEGSNNG